MTITQNISKTKSKSIINDSKDSVDSSYGVVVFSCAAVSDGDDYSGHYGCCGYRFIQAF